MTTTATELLKPEICSELEKIFVRFGRLEAAQEDPQTCLLSLLESINRGLDKKHRTLDLVVRESTYRDNLIEAGQKIH